jgi:hypothetical protein
MAKVRGSFGRSAHGGGHVPPPFEEPGDEAETEPTRGSDDQRAA